MTKSFHILIATIGKKELFNQLDSILYQLNINDYLTIVFDNMDVDNIFEKVKEYPFICNFNVIMEPEKLAFWGHGIRNKYNDLKGDFILHADDDDFYTWDAFKNIRNICIDNETLYIFKLARYFQGKYDPVPRPGCNEIKVGNISTQCGVIPKSINNKGVWQKRHGGDGKFYEEIKNHAKNIEFLDIVIYRYNQEEWYKRDVFK